MPKYRGGTDEPSNLISVSITEHTMWHFCNYQLWGRLEDKIAYKALSGKNEEKEKFLLQLSKNSMWITNGDSNKIIQKDDSIPKGWYKGMTWQEDWKAPGPKGYKQSAEHIEKRTQKAAQTRCKDFLVIPPDGEPYIYRGKRNFCREMGWDIYKEIRINDVINGKKKSYKGFRFANPPLLR